MENNHQLQYTEKFHLVSPFRELSPGVLDGINRAFDESAPVGIAVGRYDENLSICAFSRFFAENLGADVEQMLDRCSAGLRALVCQTPKFPFSAADFQKQEGKFRVYMQRRDGTPVLVACNKARAQSDQGEAMWVLAARVSSGEQALSLIEDIRQIAQWSMDYSPEGKAIAFSYGQSLLAMLEETDRAHLRTASDLQRRIHPEDRIRVRDGLRAFVHDHSRSDYTDEYRLALGSGGYKWVQVSCQAIRRADGSVSRVIGLYLNVDIWKNTLLRQERQAKANQAMEQLIHGMVNQIDRFAIIDFEKDSYEFYTQVEKLNVRPAGSYHDLLDQMAEILRPIGTTQTLAQLLSVETVRQDIKLPTNVYKVELEVIDQERIHQVSMIPALWKAGQLIQVLMVFADVTRAKKTDADARNAMLLAYEAANQANAAKTQFLTNMSHDLRTPMNAIMGMTQVAKENLSNGAKVADCLEKIEGAGKLLQNMVNELLDMGRVESGGMKLREEPFRWQELIMGVIDLYRQELRGHSHELTVRLNNLVHEQASGDQLRIQEVLSNLLTNAIKYTPDGGDIRVILSESPCTIPGFGNYSLTVEDNGLGMEEAFRAQAFEPFTREDGSRISAIPGTGLGLSIVRNLVNLMNGTVTLKSEQGKGTRITASFCLKLGMLAGNAPGESKCYRVLMADGDAVCCRRVTGELLRLGMEADSALTGRETLEMLQRAQEAGKPYDYLILAWEMSDMTGVQAVYKARKLLGENAPVFAFEDYDIGEIRPLAQEAGVDILLEKPIFRSALRELLHLETECKAVEKPLESLESLDCRGKTILIAEDNSLNREILAALLEPTGARVLTAQNGLEAFSFIRDHPGKADLVLMDIQMPEMNGYEAASAIRSLNREDTRRVPIVAVTANAFAADVGSAFRAGMNGHLSKPIDLTALAKVLNQFLM